MEITRSSLPRLMPRTPVELRLAKTRTSVTGKRMHWPVIGGQKDVVVSRCR